MSETSIVYDYDAGQVRIWTDRRGVVNGIRRRCGDMASIVEPYPGSFDIRLPMALCRSADLVTKILNTDA